MAERLEISGQYHGRITKDRRPHPDAKLSREPES
jgi:hypothetical protein